MSQNRYQISMLGVGLAMIFVPLTTVTLAVIPREEMGNATGIFNLLRNIGGSVARIWLTGKYGRVSISYLVTGLRWTPTYDFRLNGEGEAEVSQRAFLPLLPKGATIAVVPSVLAEAATMASIPGPIRLRVGSPAA